MKKLRKKLSFTVLTGALICMMITPAFAGNGSFSFSLKNMGHKYTCDTSSKSTKDNSLSYDPQWVLNVKSISYKNCTVDGTYGVSYEPLVYKSAASSGAGYYQGGQPTWRMGTGKICVDYNTKGKKEYGAKDSYWLGARMDDLLQGTVSSSGLWNADTK